MSAKIQSQTTVRKHGEVRTFVTLRYSSWCLLDRAKERREGWFYECMASLVFSAFTFEAYLNHVGSRCCSFWSSIERIPYREKVTVLAKLLKFDADFGRRPFQTIGQLFGMRNLLAHGRTEYIDKSFTVTAIPDVREIVSKLTDWEEYISLESAAQAYEDVTEAVEIINRCPTVREKHLWSHGLRGFEVQSLNRGSS